jgi:hypothetical protein
MRQVVLLLALTRVIEAGEHWFLHMGVRWVYFPYFPVAIRAAQSATFVGAGRS